MLQLLHRLIWRDAERRGRKLLNFADTEADGGRDLVRAAELTRDATLRRLYMVHAADEDRHAVLFRTRGMAILRTLPARTTTVAELKWISPGERGLDDLRIHSASDASLLAFLHLSEKTAASHFAAYEDAVRNDPPTRAIFSEIMRDETFHTNYTLVQLNRIAPRRRRLHLWRARLSRLWKAYLRVMSAIAGIMGTVILTLQYFILLPPFAFLAKRAERQETSGWTPLQPEREHALESQY